MTAQIWVPLGVAVLALVGVIYTSTITTRGTTRVASEATAQNTLEEAFKQRLAFRDEQITELRKELAEQSEKHTRQIEKLSAEVQRLTALVLRLGGDPHD